MSMANWNLKILPPMVPTYLLMADAPPGSHSVAISELPDDVLRDIGLEWTKELLKKAREMREKKKIGPP